MHLLNRNLFVMWDKDTRDFYGFSTDDRSYFEFQKKMQERVKDIIWDTPDKTLAKAVDEYNQATITIPRNQERNRKAKQKKVEAKADKLSK